VRVALRRRKRWPILTTNVKYCRPPIDKEYRIIGYLSTAALVVIDLPSSR
jgi:hypothetical protein